MTLLMKMGWRQGRSIKDSHADSLYGMPSVYSKKYAFFFQLFICLFGKFSLSIDLWPFIWLELLYDTATDALL